MKRPRTLGLNWRIALIGLAAGIGLALILMLGRGEERSHGNAGGDTLAAYSQARAARAEAARLSDKIDDLELRLKVLETRDGYTAADGTRLSNIPDPLAPRAPAENAHGPF